MTDEKALCPTCGQAAAEHPRGNAEGEVVLRIPERHIPMMRKLFFDGQMAFGMRGLGELANALRPYGDQFNTDFETFRYFNDGALGIAMIGLSSGYPSQVVIGKVRDDGRVSVAVMFRLEGDREKPLLLAENATPEAAERFKAYFEDAAIRLAPADQD